MPTDPPIPTDGESFGARVIRVATSAVGAFLGAESNVPKTVPPSQCTQVRVTAVTPTSVVLAWKAPATGTLPIFFTVFYRVHGAAYWSVGAISSVNSATVSGLKPSTDYEVEIYAHNA